MAKEILPIVIFFFNGAVAVAMYLFGYMFLCGTNTMLSLIGLTFVILNLMED
jgi:hypothetical protein